MSVAKETLGLNKGEFSKKISSIIDNHRAGSKLIGKPRDFLITACRLADRFSEVANRTEVEVRVANRRIGPRSVKMLVIKEGGKEYPVPKGQLVDALYPAKATVRKANPEKKHALAVRAAMRSAVDSQLRAYRKQLKYPLECWHTQQIIRLGMRMDVDHIHKPFLQLCDEFIESRDLTYCDIPLIGPPNLKRFKDQKLQKAWILYHEIQARLAPSLARANRSAGSGEYEAKEALIGTFEVTDEENLDLDF